MTGRLPQTAWADGNCLVAGWQVPIPEPRAGRENTRSRVFVSEIDNRNLQATSHVSFFLVFVPTRYHVMLVTRAMVQPKAAMMASNCKFSSAKMMSQTVRPFRATISPRRSASNSQAISRDLRRSATVAAAGPGSLELVNAAAADSGTIPRVLTRPLVQFRDGRYNRWMRLYSFGCKTRRACHVACACYF